MSRAFVKESDGGEGQELPELKVSPFRNLVTPAGLRRIESTVERLQSALSEARAAEDRATLARIQRDLRYWTMRLHTAEVVDIQVVADTVRFGTTVALQTPDRERIDFEIVGEDEADPANGKISYVSPVARHLIGAKIGDAIALAEGEAKIIAIE
jgi:transcription elongation GreA/GreB family factor